MGIEPMVEIGLDHNNNLTCAPAVLRVRPGEQVSFHSGLPFAIQSKGMSPFEKADIRGSLTVSVRKDTAPGLYAFVCAVYKDGVIYMDAACPGVIVDL